MVRIRDSLHASVDLHETAEIGIVQSLAKPLADAGITIFYVSTYETDFVLVYSLLRPIEWYSWLILIDRFLNKWFPVPWNV